MTSQLSTRLPVLSLYRKILRTGLNWEGSDAEASWIIRECMEEFRKNREVVDRLAIESLVDDAQKRVEVALHYKIPYPRQHYCDPGISPSVSASTSRAERVVPISTPDPFEL